MTRSPYFGSCSLARFLEGGVPPASRQKMWRASLTGQLNRSRVKVDMPQRTLSARLRAIILATPLIGVPACTGTPPYQPPPPDTNQFTLIQAADGGVQFVPSCGAPPWLTVPAGPDGGPDCWIACREWAANCTAEEIQSCSLLLPSDGGFGELTCLSVYVPVGGRRPADLVASRASQCRNPVGKHFAAAARMEASSIPAFRVLANELRAWRAPKGLILSLIHI